MPTTLQKTTTDGILSGGDLTFTYEGSSGLCRAKSSAAIVGKKYAEFTYVTTEYADTTAILLFGTGNDHLASFWVNDGAYDADYDYSGDLGAVVNGNILRVAIDIDALQISFALNGGSWLGPLALGAAADTRFAIEHYYADQSVTANFGATAFAYTPPTGFTGMDSPGGRTTPATLYVSASGNDANDGFSTGAAKATLAAIVAMSIDGDTFALHGGDTFNEALIIPHDDITVQSYGTGRATVHGKLVATNRDNFACNGVNFTGPTSNTDHGIHIVNSQGGDTKLDGPTLTDIEVSGFGACGVLIEGANGYSGFDGVLIDGVVSHGNTGTYAGGYGSAGIAVKADTAYNTGNYAHTNVQISDCVSYSNTGKTGDTNHNGSGIMVFQTDTAEVFGCEAYDNGQNSDNTGGGPVGIWAADSRDVIIHHSKSHDNKTGFKDGGGFDLDGGCHDCTLEYNMSWNNAGYGFMEYCYPDGSMTTSGNTIRFNISVDDLTGLLIAQDGTSISDGSYYNNTVFNDNLGCIIAGPNITGFVANNIFVAAAGKKLIDSWGGTAPDSGLVFAGNLYWTVSGADAIKWGATTYTSPLAWHTATGREVASPVRNNPLFANLGGTDADDYLIRHSSPAIKSGVDLAALFGVTLPADDYYGETPVARNIGADASTIAVALYVGAADRATYYKGAKTDSQLYVGAGLLF